MNTTTTKTKTTTNHEGCRLCGSKRAHTTQVARVYECAKCGAISGECYKGESYRLVGAHFDAPGACAPDQERYYDITTLGSDGVNRRHGWFNPATRLITQVG